jgi:hypothetical protein
MRPVEYSVITDAKLAKSFKVVGHSNEPTMNHQFRILREPEDFAFDAGANC